MKNPVTPTKTSKSKEGNIARVITQSAVKLNKSEDKIIEEKAKVIISKRLADLFIHCRTVSNSVIRMLHELGSNLSDKKCSSENTDNVNDVIELLNVTTSYQVQARSTINLLSNHVLENAIADLTFHKKILNIQ